MMSSSSAAPAATSPQQLPPGFRFHPTDEELILHYLRNRAASMPCPVDIIADVDIYKFDPWDLPCKAVYGDGEWYFFSPRDRKYPNGIRPNRAAGSGYWKATGTDKPVRDTCTGESVGVKKALVFYKGRPPRGTKTDWIMHEYRLLAAGDQLGLRRPPVKFRNVSMRLDDWVLCRIYKKSGQALPTTMMVPPLADYDRLMDDDHDEHLLLAAGGGFDNNIYSSNSFVYAPTSSDDGTTCSVNTTTQQQQQPAALSKIPSISDLIVDDYALAQILDTAVPPDDADLLHAPFAMHPSLNQLLAVGGDTSAHSSESEELIYSSSAAYYYPAAGGAAGVAKREASSPNECVGGGDGGAGNILGLGNPPPPAKRLRAAYAPPPASGLLLPPATPSSSQVLGGLNHNSMLLRQL